MASIEIAEAILKQEFRGSAVNGLPSASGCDSLHGAFVPSLQANSAKRTTCGELDYAIRLKG
jgi:hypothetical protein